MKLFLILFKWSDGWETMLRDRGEKKSLLSSREATKRMQVDQLILKTIFRDMKDKKVIWSSQYGFKRGKSWLMNPVTL